MRKIMTVIITCFLFIACKQSKDDKKITPDTPKSLTEESSSEISFKARKGQDLVDNLYNELLETDSSLQNFEKSVDNLDEQKEIRSKIFKNLIRKIIPTIVPRIDILQP